MILKKITIQNIASIENAEVDFTQSPLSTADLFLIHGETGAGKTTIIDAICLALFNNTPRLKTAPTSVLSFGAYSLSSRDTANMLRHGAKDALAELLFVGNDGKEYLAQWTAHATPKNINTSHLLFSDGNQIVKGAQVPPLMRDQILGMSFDDFCRTAILAQGEFTKFLKCNDDEKAAILEKLTATEEFSEVGRTIYMMWKEKNDAFALVQQQLEGIKLLTSEEIQTINQAITDASNEVASIEAKVDKLISHKDWLAQKASLSSAYAKAVGEYQKQEAFCQTPSYIEEADRLKDCDLSQQALADLRSLRENEAKLHDAETKESELSVQFSQASAGLAALHADLKSKEAKLQELDSMIVSQKAHKDMFDQSTAVLSHLQHARQMMSAVENEQKKAKSLEANLPRLRQSLIDADKAKADAEQAVTEKNNEIKNKQKEISGLDSAAIIQRTQDLTSFRDNLNQAGQSLQLFFLAIQKVEDAQKKVADLTKEIADSTPRLQTLNNAVQSAQKSYSQIEEAYRSIDLASKEWAVQARAILQDGDICPVCGNVYDASHFEQIVIKVKDAEAEKLRLAKETKEKAEKDYTELNAVLTQKNKEVDQLQNQDLNQFEKQLSVAFQQASADCRQVSIDFPAPTRTAYLQALEQGKQKREALEEQQKANNQDIEKLNTLNQELQQLNEQLQNLSVAFNSAAEAVVKAQKNLDDCSNGITTTAEKAKEYQDLSQDDVAHATCMITWPNWKEEWTADAAAFEQRFKDAAADYRNAVLQQTQLVPQVAQFRTQLSNFDSQQSALAQSWPQWTALPADKQYADNQTRRWNALITDAAAVRQQRTTALDEIQKANAALDTFYATHPGIDHARLTLLQSFAAADVRKRHKEQDDRLAQLSGAAKTHKGNLEAHLQQQPADLDTNKDTDTYVKEIDLLGGQKKTLSEGIGSNKQKLESDRQNQQAYGIKQSEMDTQKVILDRWTLFKDKYGDKEGTKFRRLAQQLIFDRLLQLANQHLARLTARYSLQTIPGTLTISLCDQYTPGFESSVHNLSGGESFMVSLSLALALSSMGREGISMDTLFIDEGFGTLSTDNQIRVMDLLQTLQRTQGKRVGIISHVPYLLERIPVQIKVSRHPSDNTRSAVQVFTATT